MGVSHRIVAAQLPHAQRITPVGKIPAQLMPYRVALYPQRWSLYLMGGDNVSRLFAPQTMGKEWSNWGRSTNDQ